MNGISVQGQSAADKNASGTVFIHSAPAALLPHIEWALGRHLGGPIGLQWGPQPMKPGQFRTDLAWQSEPSFGALVSSELLGWGSISFEIIQEEGAGHAGWRWAFTPSLGLFQGQIDSFGNALVNEHRLGAIADSATSTIEEIRTQLRLAIGEPWDAELDQLRYPTEHSEVVWLKAAAN